MLHNNQITNNVHLGSEFSCKPCSRQCIPERVARFVKHHLHGGPPESIDAEALRREVEELRQKNKELQEQVSQLQTAVCHVITISHSRKTPVYPMQAYVCSKVPTQHFVACVMEKFRNKAYTVHISLVPRRSKKN